MSASEMPSAVGRSPRGERGLKSALAHRPEAGIGRSPRGERGLKSAVVHSRYRQEGSLPSRGAWIEIHVIGIQDIINKRRSPRGERGLK